MAYVPDEAVFSRKELSHGAWDLYVIYCTHRNRWTGRCDPSTGTLAREMDCSKQHLSTCKRELVRAGWIALDERYNVRLLKGKFDNPQGGRQDSNSEKSEFKSPEIKKNLNSNSEKSEFDEDEIQKNLNSVKKNLNGNSEKSELPHMYEPTFEPTVAASCDAAAAAVAAPVQNWRSEFCDEAFVERIRTSGAFSPELVTFVWSKLRLECAFANCSPVKGQFIHWLKTERPVQTSLPTTSAKIYDMSASARASPGARPLAKCAVSCPKCFGSGFEQNEGKGVRRCTNQQTPQTGANA